jgi:ribosomal-protein-alanine N-acetyltransferase
MAEPIELRTDRLLLRRFLPEDVEDARAYRDDPEFSRYLSHIPQPFTRQHAEAFVAGNMRESWDESPTFAVVLDDHVIGTVNFDIDPKQQLAMVGFAIGRQHWGKGLASEAVRAALDWAFAAHDVAKIWACTDVRNVRSQRLMERLGMRREGLLRSHELTRDGRTDKVYYGLLRDECSGPGAGSGR